MYKLGLRRIKEDEIGTKVVEQKRNSEENIWWVKFSPTLTCADNENTENPINVKKKKKIHSIKWLTISISELSMFFG